MCDPTVSSPVAFVTGASRGIGRQLAIDFAKQGYDVVAPARSTKAAPSKLPGTIDEVADQIRAEGRRCLPLGVDLQHEDQIQSAIEQAYAAFGRVDVLINCAAVAPPGKSLELPRRHWRLTVDVNLNAPFYLMHGICPRMAAAGGGRVINISSVASQMPEFGRVGYTATKRALEAMTEALAYELKEAAVAVNVIQIELCIWSEGFAFTLLNPDRSRFEDPVIMSDACLWLARQPLAYTGHLLTLGELPQMGVIRPSTRGADAG